MKTLFKILPLLLAVVSCSGKKEAEPEVIEEPRLGFFTEDYSSESGVVKSGETFILWMNDLGIDTGTAYSLIGLCDSIFDVRKIIAGNKYEAFYSVDSLSRKLEYVVYDNDRINQTVFKCADSLGVWTAQREVSHVHKTADVSIETSLWNDMLDANASPLVILQLSDIYAWTVDFFGLQKNDRFRVLYEQTECEGDVISVDTVFFSIFSRGDKDLYAIMFDQGDGGNLYWNEKGESMRKAFLKAPLKFNRISSGFSYSRKHPVTGQIKAHTGIDYAAPTGTPVMSIGDGTVIEKGYQGAGGNTVKIRHNSVYTTAYLHLSKYASGLKVGQRVSQGEVIGYVGMTGTATGPHLDFRVWMNGSPINPLTMESPSEEPLKEENLPALDSVFHQYKTQIDSLFLQ